jgi:signal transduction histidine kinase
VVPPGVDGSTLLALLLRLATEPGEWAPLLVTDEGGALSVVPVSPGFRLGVSDAAARMGGSGSEPAQLSVRMAARTAAKLRHDINNPLTAALAEIQLLLMDVEPGSELGETLRAVEAQLRRIGELVAQLSFFRVPPS